MEFLTKYRPLRNLEFYQRKVVRFIYSSEGSEDLRPLGIPYGDLGFDSPLHFIRCIPPEFCDDFVCDKLFQRMDKTLRKGHRVFLTFNDGRIQSAIYKGQTDDGKLEAILDGHMMTYPMDQVVPYKAFLRKNVGAMLVDGPHKIVGPHVEYEEPTWDVGESIFYKPSKRWGTIVERYVIRGKAFSEVKLDQSQLKKEKVFRISLHELMREAVPYRTPIVPKNFANAQEQEREKRSNENRARNEAIKPPVEALKQNVKETPKKALVRNASTDTDTIKRNKLAKQSSKESTQCKNIKLSKSSSETETATSTSDNDSLDTDEILAEGTVECAQEASKQVQSSPVAVTDAVTVRRSPSKTSRPLTEYFHSHSVELHNDEAEISTTSTAREPKFKSVSDLKAHVSDDEEFILDDYKDSLRKNARRILTKQLASEAAQTNISEGSSGRRREYLSIENIQVPTQDQGRLLRPPTITKSDNEQLTSNGRPGPVVTPRRLSNVHAIAISTSANETSSEVESSPPPLPRSMPPPPVDQNILQPPYIPRNPSFKRAFSMIQDPYPRNHENSSFNKAAALSLSSGISSSGGYSCSEHEIQAPRQKPVPPVRSTSKGQANITRKTHSLSTYSEVEDNPPKQFSAYLQHALSVPSFEFVQNSSTLPLPPKKPIRAAAAERHASTMERQRYIKNPSAAKTKSKSVSSIMDPEFVRHRSHPLPHPFMISNIYSAVGRGRGIQSGYHSCYADISLFALFYCSNVFDTLLEEDPQSDVGMKRDVKRILREKIIRPLRLSAFCDWESVSHLRETMLPLSSKLNSSFMDSEEFLYLLFENAIRAPQFIQYSNGRQDYMYQIIAKPKDRMRCQDIQFLLGTSMVEVNNLKFAEVPSPALLLCMPRCNGRLVYYEGIIPNVTIDIVALMDKMPKKCLCENVATLQCRLCYNIYGKAALEYCMSCQRLANQIHHHIGHDPYLQQKEPDTVRLNLLAVICIKNNNYSAFVKVGPEKYSPWLYYEAVPNEFPDVKLLSGFEKWLDKLEREPWRYREFAKTNMYIKKIITESHICVYYEAKERARVNGFAESFIV